MRNRRTLVAGLLIMAAFSMAMTGGQPHDADATADFGLHVQDTLVARGGNAYFSLHPGTFLRLEGEDDGNPVVVELTVLDKTRHIGFQAEGGYMTVKTRVVKERDWINGKLSHVSLSFLACCPKSGNIYRFGEEVNHLENGVIVGHEGSWRAGVDGALPGLFMPGFFLLGSKYYQELAPGVAMDCAKNVGMGLTYETPAGVFTNCVVVSETTPLEPDEEVLKVYAPGVGLIMDGNLTLVEYRLAQ